MASDKIKSLEGYEVFEDVLTEIDKELDNINKILDVHYQTLHTGSVGGKMIYSTIKLSELKRMHLDSKIGILTKLNPKKNEDGGIQLTQAMLDSITKATAASIKSKK